MARAKGWGSAYFGGVHTHHLVFGIVIALTAGSLQFALMPTGNDAMLLLLAAAFGCGAALILDEFALVFYLKDVYWEREGRKSVDAVIIASILGLLFLLHTAPFGKANDSTHVFLTLDVMFNMFFVVIAALKGKVYVSIFGVFIAPLAILGALRLAKPKSLYARHFYAHNRAKRKRSVRRYKSYARQWRPKKERLLDILGGKIEHVTRSA